MSYDLTVYGRAPLARAALIALIREAADLDVEDEVEKGSRSVQIVRGARRAYCFTVDGPFDVEPEDIPIEVVNVALGATTSYQILVEGSAEASIPHAVRFAKRLGVSLRGAAIDLQTEETWPKKSRAAPLASGKGRIDVVELAWYFHHGDTGIQASFLDAARRYFPEALPRRFGDYEPLQHKLDTDGEQAFVALGTGSTTGVHWKGKSPVIDGSYHPARVTNSSVDPGSVRLSIDRSALMDDKWRAALQNLFIKFGTKAHAFFASAEIVRNLGWSGRTVWYDGKEEERNGLVRYREGWLGLPPYPVWWTLFGPEYEALVRSHVAPSAVSTSSGYLFRTWSDAPSDRDALKAELPKSGVFRNRSHPWLPPALTVTQLAKNPHEYLRPLKKADLMPESLRSSP